jgi:hypothetical protein
MRAVKQPDFDTPTTIGTSVADREEVREFAESRGMEKQRVLGLLLEGWKVLTPEQEAEALRRYSARRPRRRAPQPVGG